jgi:TP901 family phage tail tape measure protein
MALNVGLGFLFKTRDLASAGFDRIGARLNALDGLAHDASERIGRSFARVGMGLGAMGLGIGGLAAGFGLANKAGKFEQALARVGAVAGATGADLALLRDAALNAGLTTAFDPTAAAEGLQELAAAGFSARQAAQLLVPTLNLASASLGQLNVEASAGLVSQALKAWSMDASQAGIVVDSLTASSNMFALSARELPLALGTAARGAGVARQSFADTLIALGLVRNVVPSVERSATAVSTAMERMANPQTQRMLQGIGVAAVDAGGGFRSILDVIGDMAPALNAMSDAKRGAFLLRAFGSEAVGGISAVLTQMNSGIAGANGQILKGAAALGYLRDQMANASGAAEAFKLNTFQGQKDLLGSAFETLQIAGGEAFAQTFKPVVGFVLDSIRKVTAAILDLSPETKSLIAKVVVGTSAFVGLAGAALTVKAGFFLVKLAARSLAGAIWTAFAPLAPFVLGAGAAFLIAFAKFRKSGEGIGDFAGRMFGKVSLGFQALVQLFTDGGFSGSVMTELNKAENSGLKRFVIGVYEFVGRLGQMWEGVKAGFSAVWEDVVGPVLTEVRGKFDLLGSSVNELGASFGVSMGSVASGLDGTIPA